MERPTFPHEIEAELHRVCAIIVKETNPPSDDDEDLPEHQATLKKYEEYKAQKAAEQARAAVRIHRHSSSRRQDEPRQPAPKLTAYVPTHAARDNMAQLPSFPFEPLEPTHTKLSAGNRSKGKEADDPLSHVRASLDTRPKTSAAACIDYTGPSVDTSASTSRTNTTYDDRGRPISTGLTSAALTPGDDKRASYTNMRVSEQVLQDGASASLADATAKAWMVHELARRRAEYNKSGNAGRPGSTRSEQTKQYEPPERPLSRAGSIAGSFRDGIVGYIRPRASMDSARSIGEGSLSRTQSRSSSIKSSSGSKFSWRPKDLRRKGSWSSFRSAKPEREEDTSAADKAPNLNRALPALPGLDQYKEKKQPKHVGLLMRVGRKPTENKPEVEATVVDDGMKRILSHSDERTQQDMRKAGKEKVERGAIVASDKASHLTIPSQYQQSLGRPSTSISAVTMPSTTNLESRQTLDHSDKKPSFRKRLTRFWSMGGGDKGMGGQRKNFGNMVVAN